MGKCTFKGGVHPYDGKELSKDVPIKELFPEGDMVFPLSQHIGAPAVPVVAKGDHVLAGQLIAEAGGLFQLISIHLFQVQLRRLSLGHLQQAVSVIQLLLRMMESTKRSNIFQRSLKSLQEMKSERESRRPVS